MPQNALRPAPATSRVRSRGAKSTFRRFSCAPSRTTGSQPRYHCLLVGRLVRTIQLIRPKGRSEQQNAGPEENPLQTLEVARMSGAQGRIVIQSPRIQRKQILKRNHSSQCVSPLWCHVTIECLCTFYGLSHRTLSRGTTITIISAGRIFAGAVVAECRKARLGGKPPGSLRATTQ